MTGRGGKGRGGGGGGKAPQLGEYLGAGREGGRQRGGYLGGDAAQSNHAASGAFGSSATGSGYRRGFAKPVEQVRETTGGSVKIHPSVKAAANHAGVTKGTLINWIKQGRVQGGYVWRYSEGEGEQIGSSHVRPDTEQDEKDEEEEEEKEEDKMASPDASLLAPASACRSWKPKPVELVREATRD